MSDTSAYEDHVHPEMLRRNRLAWEAWCSEPKLAEACRTLGMSEVEWARRFVEQMGPISGVVKTGCCSCGWLGPDRDIWVCADDDVRVHLYGGERHQHA